MSILNAAGNAALAFGTLGNITGQNSTLAQPSATLLGLNVPGVPLVSFRDYFLASMESWITTIPLRTQFVALIHSFPAGLNTSMIQSLEIIDAAKKDFNIDAAKKALTSAPLQKIVGCLFLQGADIPSESLSPGAAAIENNRGFIQGSILNGRESFANTPLTLQFRETNTSFTDSVMRPWLILAAHSGYVARDLNNPAERLKDPKCNITLIQYSRSYQKISQVPRKIWNFYGCVPIGLGPSRNLTYDTEEMESYAVPFLYDHYGVQDNLYLPLPDLIRRVSNGQIPRISPFQK